MAKVSGPLFSQEASGKFGGALVYARRRGQNVVRSLVIPSNPQTDNQVAQRIRLAVMGLITKRINVGKWTYAGQTEDIKEHFQGRVRTGEVWNSAFGREALGPANATYIAQLAVFEALTDDQQEVWNVAAETAIAGLADYTRGETTIDSGFMLFLAEYTLAEGGYGDAFSTTVPVAIAAG